MVQMANEFSLVAMEGSLSWHWKLEPRIMVYKAGSYDAVRGRYCAWKWSKVSHPLLPCQIVVKIYGTNRKYMLGDPFPMDYGIL